MGDVLVEAIHPLAGQREGHVLVGQAVAQLHAHRRQGQVIGAAEREQREIGVTGALHAGFDRLDHRLGLHITGGAGEHARLAEAAASGATAADLHREAIVHRFDVGHQAHGVVGHRRGGAAQHPRGNSRLQRHLANAVGARPIERRHIDAGHLGQVAQQVAAAEAGGAPLGHHQADFGQHLLTVAQHDEIEEGREGLGVAGGGGATGKDQWRRRRISQGQITAIGGADRDLRQLQHREDVGGAELITEREAEDVEGRQRPAALHGEQRFTAGPEPLRQIRPRQITAIAQLAGNAVENRIENDVAGVARSHLVDLGVGERPTHASSRPGLIPVAPLHPQLIAQVAAGLGDAAIHQCSEIHWPIERRLRRRTDRLS